MAINNEQIFFVGDDYFRSLLLDIGTARKSIELETYIFAFDALGQNIADALIKAAKQGVKVKILVDGAGTPNWSHHLIAKLEQAGAETRIFHPFPWRLWQWSRSHIKVPSLLKIIYLFFKINTRNHRKVCIIDKKIVYTGSFNISSDHLYWRDTGVCLRDINLRPLSQAFASTWSHTPIHEQIMDFFKNMRTNPIIRLNNTWYRRRILNKNLLLKIKNCKQKIWITNAYFVPNKFLLKRLNEAAKSGIDVRILLPQYSDVVFMPWASKAFYTSLLKAGVRIFEYKPCILHAKTLIIDKWMIVGSSNMNHRSLLHDLEVDINICSHKSKELLEQQFLIDQQNSKEIFLPNWRKRPWHQNLIGTTLLYLKYII